MPLIHLWRCAERVDLHQINSGRLHPIAPQAPERLADYSTQPMWALPLL